MRISSNSADPGYSAWKRARALGRKITIMLDGVEQTKRSMADEESGQVTRGVLDERGWFQIDPNKPDQVWQETVSGKVQIALGPKGSES